MASSLQFAVSSIRLNNYSALIAIVAVGYDYVLTYSKEIEYIWNKPWTWVSTLFVLARYLGLSYIVAFSLLGSSFFPGPAKEYPRGDILFVYGTWATLVFLGAADFVMTLRVWALYERSRWILCTLLPLLVAEVILGLVPCIITTARNGPEMVVDQVLDYSFCVAQYNAPTIPEAAAIVQITLAALLCLLIIIQFIKQAVQIYNATKQFQLNRYTNLFAREGMIYFLAILTYAVLNILYYTTNITANQWWPMLVLVQTIPTFTLAPRFILSLRALVAHDAQGRHGSDIDTAFGLGLSSGNGSAGSMMMFADAGQNDGLDEGGCMPMDERGA